MREDSNDGVYFFLRFMFLFVCQAAHRCHILRVIKLTLLCAGLLDVHRSTAAAAGQLHGGDDDGVGFIHVGNRHLFLGGRLTTRHLHNDKERRGQAPWQGVTFSHCRSCLMRSTMCMVQNRYHLQNNERKILNLKMSFKNRQIIRGKANLNLSEKFTFKQDIRDEYV